MGVAVEVSYCVVNTGQRELLLRCLDSIARERRALPFDVETLVLDNASDDGSAQAAGEHPVTDELIALELRRGKAQNDSELLRRARGRYCLLLNEDSELEPGATAALYAALDSRADAACAGAALVSPHGLVQASAWRFPSLATAIAGALFLHRLFTVQSRGSAVRQVDWSQSSALLVRREAAAAIDWLDEQFFVYSDEVDFQKRLHDAGWVSLYVPGARAIHHEQLATGAIPRRRIVEFHRNRDRYMRKHHGAVAAALVRLLTFLPYTLRALTAPLVPGRSAARMWAHAVAALFPARGEGIREAAAEYNRGLHGSFVEGP
jgi:GT2 family glycosyltransferase